jgi:hypothetical protein
MMMVKFRQYCWQNYGNNENRFYKISPTNKFEGLTLFKTKDQIQLLLCEDNDTDTFLKAVFIT